MKSDQNSLDTDSLPDNAVPIHGKKARSDSDMLDIPLHEDLSEFQTELRGMESRVDKLDIDLTDLRARGADFAGVESQMLNPLKPLSRQINLNIGKLAESGFATPAQTSSPLMNSYRMIKRPLINIARGKGSKKPVNPNVIMITSSMSGEGKSYTAINLAFSIAMEQDKHVMLVDADVNKPSHHEIFEVNNPLGLTDLLLGKVKGISEVLTKTSIPSLSLMFAGTQYPNATELLASQAMEDLITDISGRYPDRIVIFDSPPLLLTTEASALAPHMGQVVMVIEAEKTLKSQVENSLSLLSNEVVMLLLNKVRAKSDEAGFGYYGYGYAG
ncbi:MAG: XrtA-associated tyrosine autokinase [Candidatus Latescibacterota bacterium]